MGLQNLIPMVTPRQPGDGAMNCGFNQPAGHDSLVDSESQFPEAYGQSSRNSPMDVQTAACALGNTLDQYILILVKDRPICNNSRLVRRELTCASASRGGAELLIVDLADWTSAQYPVST